MRILPMSHENWLFAAQTIKEGGLVAFPTDTVYGIACDPFNVRAIERLYSAKGRDREKAIPLLLSDANRIKLVAGQVSDIAEKLGAAFWPGALTLVVERAPGLPEELGGGPTIAVRVPDHSELRAFLDMCGGALATSSANLSGRPDSVDAAQVADYFAERVDLIVDGGRTGGGIPSTVIDCTSTLPVVLRPGAIGQGALAKVDPQFNSSPSGRS